MSFNLKKCFSLIAVGTVLLSAAACGGSETDSQSQISNAVSDIGVDIVTEVKSADNIPQVFYRHYPALKNGSLNVSELARVCGMSRTTVYKYISIKA